MHENNDWLNLSRRLEVVLSSCGTRLISLSISQIQHVPKYPTARRQALLSTLPVSWGFCTNFDLHSKELWKNLLENRLVEQMSLHQTYSELGKAFLSLRNQWTHGTCKGWNCLRKITITEKVRWQPALGEKSKNKSSYVETWLTCLFPPYISLKPTWSTALWMKGCLLCSGPQ